MPHIDMGNYDHRDCLCCGDRLIPGGEHCMCRETAQWYQNSHGEVACELHMREKFSVKSLADIKRERELAQARNFNHNPLKLGELRPSVS